MNIPLIIPRINWGEYIPHTSLRKIDSSPVVLKEYAKFITSLSEFRHDTETDPTKVLRRPGDLLKHLFFSFLISGSKKLFFKLMEFTELNIIHDKDKAIVSGTLDQWKRGTINCLGSIYKPTEEMRKVFNECFEFFEFAGLKPIFYDYRKLGLRDGTYLLEYRK